MALHAELLLEDAAELLSFLLAIKDLAHHTVDKRLVYTMCGAFNAGEVEQLFSDVIEDPTDMPSYKAEPAASIAVDDKVFNIQVEAVCDDDWDQPPWILISVCCPSNPNAQMGDPVGICGICTLEPYMNILHADPWGSYSVHDLTDEMSRLCVAMRSNQPLPMLLGVCDSTPYL